MKAVFKHTYIRLFLIVFLLLFNNSTYAQGEEEESKTKFMDKIGHWFVAYGMSSPEFIEKERLDFKSKAFAEVYIEGLIAHDAWMFGLLNKITKFRYEAKQNPHILIEVSFKPITDELDDYNVLFKITSSKSVSIDLDKIAKDVVGEFFNGTYADPQEAVDDVQLAIQKALTTLAEKLGDQLAPDLMVKYDNEIFWDGRDIHILDDATNTIELEAIGKDGSPLNAADISWTNATPISSSAKATVDITGVTNKEVLLYSDGDDLTVNVTRLGVDPDINELLRQLLIELLTVEQVAAQDTIVVLRQDSIQNLTDLRAQIALLEQYNFPLENADGTTSYVSELVTLQDSSLFLAASHKVDGFKLLRKRRRLTDDIKRKVNVAAFADLIVDEPERIKDLLEELLRNSGRLIARLILGRDSDSQKDAARDIVVDFLNRNLDRIANVNTEDTFVEVPLPVIVIEDRSKQPTFKASQRLYISEHVQFDGREEFITTMTTYLDQLETPTVMVLNYSQDVGTASYQNRSTGARPIGLPAEYDFISISVVNIPGSVNEVSVFEGDSPLVEKARDAGIKDAKALMELIEDDDESALEGGIDEHIAGKLKEFGAALPGNFYAIKHCENCDTEQDASSQTYYYSDLTISPESGVTLFGNNLNLHSAEIVSSGTQSCFVAYVSTGGVGVSIEAGLFQGGYNQINAPSLVLVDGEGKWFVCTNQLSDWSSVICEDDFDITESYIDDLLGHLNSCLDSDVIAHTNIEPNELNELQQLVDDFAKDQSIAAQVTIVDQSDFESTVNSVNIDKDVHLIIGKSGNQYTYKFLYRDELFDQPLSKTISSTGETISLEYQWNEVETIRDGYMDAAISGEESIGNLTKREEPTLNIFERGMWVVKTTRDVLAEIKVPEPLWNGAKSNPYPFDLESFTSGLGDGAIDELKSIPDLVILGLSMFDTEQNSQLWEAIKSIDLNSIGEMFSDKGAKYTGGGDVAWHEGGYDVVQIASLFYGAAFLKGSKKAKETADGFLKVLGDLPDAVKDRLNTLSKTQRDALLKDLGDSDELLKWMQDASKVDAWKVLNDGGVDDLIKRNPEALEIIDKYKNTVDSDLGKLTDKFKNAANKEDALSDVITEVRRKARQSPGASTGNGIVVEGKWMRGTEGNIGLFPKRIADKLKGKQFKDFNEFRGAFWKTVADVPDLAEQFKPQNISRMQEGLAPSVKNTQNLGGRRSYEIHHKTPIHDGGNVYDIDNMVIVTPRYHKEILDPAYHFNK